MVTLRHAARGEVYDSEAGPGRPCRGLEWVVIQLGRTRDSGLLVLPCVRSPTHSLSQQGPTHGITLPHASVKAS